MLGASCLVKNTQLLQDLKDLVEYVGYEQVSKNRPANVQSIYNIVRESGIEIDLQTVGHLYNEVLPKDFKQFQSIEEVNEQILKNYNDAIERAALLEEAEESEQQIGQDKPEVYVVNGLLNMFTNANIEDAAIKSDFLKMQNALWKGIQRKLNLPENKKPETKQQWKDILNQALGYEQLGITDLNGKLNSISDLYEGMRQQLHDATTEMEKKGDFATIEKWNEMIDKLESSTYSLLFSKGEAKGLLEGMMKDAGFAKTLKNGKTILDWNKLADNIGSVQDLRANVERVLEDNGFNQSVIDGVKNSLESEFNDLQARVLEKQTEIAEREAQKPEKTLSAQAKRIDLSPEKKSDLKRLAELNNLGIFESSHDKILYNLLGVPDLQQQDIDDLKSLSEAASNLFREIDKNYGSDVFASRHLQTIQRSIDAIIARNIGNKTALLKIINGIKAFFDILLTGLLMRPFTILENLYSGVKEIVVPTILGKGLKKEDFQIYRKMLSDVVIRGQAYGEEIGNFAPQELYTNTLKWKWKGGTAKEKAESVLFALMMPGRVGLLGFDSANKVTITNKTFNNAIYQALTQQGMNKEDATKFMNEALYGENFEKSKDRAKELIEKINADLPDKYKVPVNSRTIATFANDIVKHNLNANGALTNEVIEAAYKSAYHVAGYGLGHEANNVVSTSIKGYRNRRKQEGERLAKEKKWDQLAKHRLLDTLVNGLVLRFTGGATNWIYLRFQSGLGVGLATGFMGNWNGDIDFKDKKTIQQSIKDIHNRRNMIGRSTVGLSATALAYLYYFIMFRGEGDDDEKKKRLAALKEQKEVVGKNKKWSEENEKSKAETLNDIGLEIQEAEMSMSVMKRIKANWMGSRLFRKTAPDIMLLHYYLDTDKSNYLAALNFVQQTTGLGSDFSTSSKIQSASTLAYRGNTDAANGELASIAGDRFAVPLWSAYKDWSKLVQWIGGKEVSSDYKKPTTFTEGLFGGGAMEDMGAFKRNPVITNLPGIGEAAYEKFKEKKIENFNDIKKKEGWWNMKYEDEEGNEHFIIRTEKDRIKAREAFKKYQKQE